MANKKKKNNPTKKKKTTTTQSSVKKNTTPKKKTTSSVKQTAKKTTVKKTTTKKAVTKKSTPKKVVPKKLEEKQLTKEEVVKKIQEPIIEEEKIEIPKKKQTPKTKEVSKNKNEAKKVVKEEKFVDKKEKKEEPTRVEKVEKAIQEEIEKSAQPIKKLKKGNAKAIEKNKKSVFKKKYSKLIRKIKMYGINSVFPLKILLVILLIVGIAIAVPKVIDHFLNQKDSFDISVIPEKIDQVKTIAYNIDDTNSIISSSNAFSGLKDYYEYDFKNVFNLEPKTIDEYVMKYNKSKGYVFFVVKPKQGEEENVKNILVKFLSDNKINDYEYLEYGQYQIYIKSKDSDSDKIVVSKVRQSQIRVFNILQELKKDEIERVTGISSTYYSKALVKTAMLRTDTCEYMIFKPSNAMAKTKIMNTMNDYYAGLEAKWQNNDQENYDLVKTRHFEEYNGYLIYVVSHDNDLVMNLIKG